MDSLLNLIFRFLLQVSRNITDFYILTLKKKKLAEYINSERFLVT